MIKQEKFSSPLELSILALDAPTLDGAIIRMFVSKTMGVNQDLVSFLFEVPPWE